jgi:hypothetical protein
MSFIKTYLITAALGLAVASGISALSLHENINRGNGGDQSRFFTPPAATDPTLTWSQPGRSALYGNNLSMSAESTVHADELLFGRANASVLDN